MLRVEKIGIGKYRKGKKATALSLGAETECEHMENIKRILSYTRRAVEDYEMIRPGDKVAVGVSAGKDST